MAVPIGTEDEAGGVEGMKALIDQYDGNLAAIARHLRVHRTSVLRVIQKYQELQEHLTQARHAVFDDIEHGIIIKAKGGDLIAQMFYLKTQGHIIGRPYNEKPTDGELERNAKNANAPVTLDEWRNRQISTRSKVAAMLEDFAVDAEATIVETESVDR